MQGPGLECQNPPRALCPVDCFWKAVGLLQRQSRHLQEKYCRYRRPECEASLWRPSDAVRTLKGVRLQTYQRKSGALAVAAIPGRVQDPHRGRRRDAIYLRNPVRYFQSLRSAPAMRCPEYLRHYEEEGERDRPF